MRAVVFTKYQHDLLHDLLHDTQRDNEATSLFWTTQIILHMVPGMLSWLLPVTLVFLCACTHDDSIVTRIFEDSYKKILPSSHYYFIL